MAAAAITPTFLAAVRSAVGGDLDIQVSWASFVPQGYVHQAALTQAGFTSVVLPTAPTKLIVIVPPPANVQAVTLKGITGDTGIPLSASEATILCTTTTTLGLALAAGSNQIFTFCVL